MCGGHVSLSDALQHHAVAIVAALVFALVFMASALSITRRILMNDIKAVIAELEDAKKKMADKDATIASQGATITKQTADLATKDASIADLQTQVSTLKAQIGDGTIVSSADMQTLSDDADALDGVAPAAPPVSPPAATDPTPPPTT